MKKPWMIVSVIIGTIVFLYAMSFISAQNVCSWVRSYECIALQKKTTDTLLTKQAQDFVKMIDTQKNNNVVQTAVINNTPTSTSVQQDTINTQQAAATQKAKQEAVAAQQAAKKAAAQLLAQQAAAQQSASATVNTRTRAS